MTNPTPDITPEGPAYEGRLLPHPSEEIVDQGLQFDVGTVFTRRRLLGFLGVGAGALTVAACGGASSAASSSASSSAAAGDFVEIPDETNGPYPADGTNGPDILEQSGIVRSDITSSFGDASGVADGVPFTFKLTIIDMANGNVPFEGAAVYVWHCDAGGNYSMYSQGIENENYLRGVQVADKNGEVTFTSIFPACYSGRWPHVHFEVYPDVDSITDHDNCISTSQLAVPEDACNDVFNNDDRYTASVKNLSQVTLESDNVFSDGAEQQLATLKGSRSKGYTGTLTVAVDTGTEPTGGSAPGGGGPGGSAPDGGPGGGSGGGPGSPPTS